MKANIWSSVSITWRLPTISGNLAQRESLICYKRLRDRYAPF
jgi:hypothetical protein